MGEGGLVGTAGAAYGVEGGDNAGTVGYGASAVGTGGAVTDFQTTTTTTTSTVGEYPTSTSVVGLPSVPSNQLVSTLNPEFLPGPYISRVVDNPNENVQ